MDFNSIYSAWNNFDFNYLLWLQNLRISINSECLNNFMQNISHFVALQACYGFALFAFVYWVFNKRFGLYIATSFTAGHTLNAFEKLCACIYRPWILDTRIIPAGDAIATATGYSFPSGHTSAVTTICGGMAIFLKKYGYKILSYLFIALVMLIGFSRNYLGVHTLKDVLTALITGIIVLFVVGKIFNFIEKHRSTENIFIILGLVLTLAIMYYVTHKDYPTDYLNGKLLADPVKMQYDIWNDLGNVLGLLLGRLCEKYFIKFRPTGFNFKGVILNILGVVLLVLILNYSLSFFTGLIGAEYGRTLTSFVQLFYIVAAWPLVLKIFGYSK